jgi:hypothetical protein
MAPRAAQLSPHPCPPHRPTSPYAPHPQAHTAAGKAKYTREDVQRCLEEYGAINVWTVNKEGSNWTVIINDLEF